MRGPGDGAWTRRRPGVGRDHWDLLGLRLDRRIARSSPAIFSRVMDSITLGESSGDTKLPDPGVAAPRDDVIAAPAPGTHASASVALAVPSGDELDSIARRQDAKRAAMQAAKLQDKRDDEEDEEAAAAALIQRNYRGYKQRRELAGMGMDASTRWVEVCETCFPLDRHPPHLLAARR